MSDPLLVEPLTSPPDATIIVPGSKSLTNRALVCAVLAKGTSTLDNVLFSDDTEAMFEVARALGANVNVDEQTNRVVVTGVDGAPAPGPTDLDVRMSGTTARFSVPLASRGSGLYTVDGHPSMQARPMGTIADALRQLGDRIEGDALPMRVSAEGGRGGTIDLAASVSSQFASGILLSAPGVPGGLVLRLVGEVVSQPYLDMTVAVMAAFGSGVTADSNIYDVPADDGYTATDYQIEPDASAASYFFGAAAVTGGRVRIDGLGTSSLQGDVDFVRVLERMGAEVTMTADSTTVVGPSQLSGVDVDMADISDTAQTLAAIAPFASSPTRVTGIDFIRNKETDRIAAVVAELRRLGIDASEDDDGFTVHPGTPQSGTVQTYEDHRMAMSFSLIGLRQPGISIADPACVAKTVPEFFEILAHLR